MPHHAEKLTLPLSLEDAANVCQDAIAGIGWRVFDTTPRRMICKENAPAIGWTWPVEVVVSLHPAGDNTIVELEGSNGGWGPVQAGQCRGQVGNLRNRIEVTARQSAKSSSSLGGISLTEELQRLADLRTNGVLTDEEFNAAKQKLLNP